MPNIGLVIEGAHDREMLFPLIGGLLASKGIKEVSLNTLHPKADETGSIGDGGWQRVKVWCKSNSGVDLTTYFKPLFEDQPAYDAIVFHVDGGSLLDVCGASKSVDVPKLPIAVGARVDHIVQALTEWLAPQSHHSEKLAFAIPVQSTEAWVLAAEAIHHDIESMDAKVEFQRTYDRGKHGPLSTFYTLRSTEASKHVDKILAQCVSFRVFGDSIVGVLTLKSKEGAVPKDTGHQDDIS